MSIVHCTKLEVPTPSKRVTEAARQAKEVAETKRWKYEWKGQEIVVAEQMGRILKKVEKYAMIVDIFIQHSPETTALVWGGLRFLLTVGPVH